MPKLWGFLRNNAQKVIALKFKALIKRLRGCTLFPFAVAAEMWMPDWPVCSVSSWQQWSPGQKIISSIKTKWVNWDRTHLGARKNDVASSHTRLLFFSVLYPNSTASIGPFSLWNGILMPFMVFCIFISCFGVNILEDASHRIGLSLRRYTTWLRWREQGRGLRSLPLGKTRTSYKNFSVRKISDAEPSMTKD